MLKLKIFLFSVSKLPRNILFLRQRIEDEIDLRFIYNQALWRNIKNILKAFLLKDLLKEPNWLIWSSEATK